MTEQTQTKPQHTVTTHLIKEGEVVVEGKRIALVPETLYSRTLCCPHCKSTAKPDYLSDLQNLPEQLADLLRCSEEECRGVFIVLAHPRTYLQKPIFFNWQLNQKGGEDNGTQSQEAKTTATTAEGDQSPEGAAVNA